jgi:hypothetical protein
LDPYSTVESFQNSALFKNCTGHIHLLFIQQYILYKNSHFQFKISVQYFLQLTMHARVWLLVIVVGVGLCVAVDNGLGLTPQMGLSYSPSLLFSSLLLLSRSLIANILSCSCYISMSVSLFSLSNFTISLSFPFLSFPRY